MSGNIRHSTTSIRAMWMSFIALKLQRIFASAALQIWTFARPIHNHELWSPNPQTTEEMLLSGSPLPTCKSLQHPRKLVENAEQRVQVEALDRSHFLEATTASESKASASGGNFRACGALGWSRTSHILGGGARGQWPESNLTDMCAACECIGPQRCFGGEAQISDTGQPDLQ